MIKKLISSIMMVAFLSVGTTATFTSCATVPYIQSVQAWLNDPKNQALIQEIAQAANILIGAFMDKPGATTRATVTGKLCATYPSVPAGAIAAIVASPASYIKATRGCR